MVRSVLLSVCMLLAAASCGRPEQVSSGGPVQFFADESPAKLSAWRLYSVAGGAVGLNEGVVPYDLNSTLFTDYAHKLRTIWVPEGKTAAYRTGTHPDFPVGTVISKTFYYPRVAGETGAFSGRVEKSDQPSGRMDPALEDLAGVRLVETRLLVHRETGWIPLVYVWNDEQTDATLKKIGDVQPLTLVDGATETAFNYVVPNTNQCAGCHATNNTTREVTPIGVRPRHINKDYAYDSTEMNQLEYLALVGYLEHPAPTEAVPQNADWLDETLSLDARARSYLDINCSHCHNKAGPADTSGLDLSIEARRGPALGLCKLPIAAGSGTGGLPYDIVPGHPEHSILLYRMETTDAGAMMPELGRSLAHEEAADLIREWILTMEGECSS